MTQSYLVTAAVVKVSVGPADGNRIARMIPRGHLIPEGVDPSLLKKLEERKLIEKAADPAPDAAALAAAEKAAADKAAAEKAAADKAAAEKAAADKAAAEKAAAEKAAADKTAKSSPK